MPAVALFSLAILPAVPWLGCLLAPVPWLGCLLAPFFHAVVAPLLLSASLCAFVLAAVLSSPVIQPCSTY
eukprot:SAG31_NODE_4071_length_3616_cov_3.727040_4_plen_70_part_00